MSKVVTSAEAARGNALFLILIAVALFAALSYAITQSGRGGGSTAREQESLNASQIAQYAASVQQAVTRLRLIGGCSESQLNFANSLDGNYVNASAPSDGHCDVFSALGGGLSFQKMPSGTGDAAGYPIITGSSDFLGTPTSGTDLAIYVPIQSATLCAGINAAMGLPSSLAIDAIAQTLNSAKFKGSYVFGNAIPDNGGNAAGYTGARSGCLQAYADAGWYPYSAGINYFFYSVLLER